MDEIIWLTRNSWWHLNFLLIVNARAFLFFLIFGTWLFWSHFRWNLLDDSDLCLFEHWAWRLLVEWREFLIMHAASKALFIFVIYNWNSVLITALRPLSNPHFSFEPAVKRLLCCRVLRNLAQLITPFELHNSTCSLYVVHLRAHLENLWGLLVRIALTLTLIRWQGFRGGTFVLFGWKSGEHFV